MSEENQTTVIDPSNGQPTADVQKAYENLQALYGKQTNELGEARDFITKVTPVLEKLDQEDPILIQAILDGTINADLAKAVKDGTLTKVEAAAVTKATEEVNKKIEKSDKTFSDEEIEKLVADKAAKLIEDKNSEINTRLDKLSEITSKQQAQEMLNNFVEAHPDFDAYAEEIDVLMKKRSDKDEMSLDDLSLIYDAAKGAHIAKLMKENNQEELAEIAKLLAGAGASSENNGGVLDEEDDILPSTPSRGANSFINW